MKNIHVAVNQNLALLAGPLGNEHALPTALLV